MKIYPNKIMPVGKYSRIATYQSPAPTAVDKMGWSLGQHYRFEITLVEDRNVMKSLDEAAVLAEMAETVMES